MNAGVEFDWRALSLQELFPPSEELQSKNPMGLVPVLEPDDGLAVIDSPEILNYIDDWITPLWSRERLTGIRSRRLSAMSQGIMTYAVREFQGLRVTSPLSGETESNIVLIGRVFASVNSEIQNNAAALCFDENNFTQAAWDIAATLDYLDFRMSSLLDWRGKCGPLAAFFEKFKAERIFQDTRPVS